MKRTDSSSNSALETPVLEPAPETSTAVDRKDVPYHTSGDGALELGYEYVPKPIAQPALLSQVIMQDDSMAPVFREGDRLTIDTEKEFGSGYYVLIQLGELLLVRRFIYRKGKPFSYVAGIGDRPIVDDKDVVKHWGVVTAVEHLRNHHPNGKFEEFDLEKLGYFPDDEESEESGAEKVVEAVA